MSNTRFLATFYSEKQEFIEIWESYPGIKEYMYYNNTDKPDNLTLKQWKKRQSDWEKAIPSFHPYESGIVVEFIIDCPSWFLFSEKLESYISKFQPSLEERAEEMARRAIWKEVAKKIKKVLKGKEK